MKKRSANIKETITLKKMTIMRKKERSREMEQRNMGLKGTNLQERGQTADGDKENGV
jgi:hypothetical protein